MKTQSAKYKNGRRILYRTKYGINKKQAHQGSKECARRREQAIRDAK